MSEQEKLTVKFECVLSGDAIEVHGGSDSDDANCFVLGKMYGLLCRTATRSASEISKSLSKDREAQLQFDSGFGAGYGEPADEESCGVRSHVL